MKRLAIAFVLVTVISQMAIYAVVIYSLNFNDDFVKYQKRTLELEQEKNRLEIELVKLKSFKHLSEQAIQMGFDKPNLIIYINSQLKTYEQK